MIQDAIEKIVAGEDLAGDGFDSVPEGDMSLTTFFGLVTSPATNERIERRISFGILSIWHIGADSM